MKTLAVALGFVCLFSNTQDVTQEYINYLQNLPPKVKKRRFVKLLLPYIKKVDNELRTLYKKTKNDLANNQNKEYIKYLKRKYKTNNNTELLKRIKPHPKSITLAQAAIESAWGTSRFFVVANNIFGMWTTKNQKCKVAALKLRNNNKQIWLRKYKTYECAIRSYYYTIATNKAYKEFREARWISNDPYYIASFLHNYSERGYDYTVDVIKVIYYNDFTKYD